MFPAPLKPALFLDRDGVIVENRLDYVKTIAEVQFLPGALLALAQAAQLDCRIIVVTNQSAVGRGLLTEQALAAINASIHQAIVAAGGRIDAWYVCPHVPEADCACRKPRPGMLLTAAADWHIDLPASVMVGDAVSDAQAGQAAGAQSILVRTGLVGGQTAQLGQAGLVNVMIVHDLAAAVQHVAASPAFTKTPPDGGAGKQRTPGILPHNPPLDSARP